MEKPLKDMYLWNSTFVSTKEEESLRPIQNNAVYEVLRIEDGIPLFFEEHYERLVASAAHVGRPLPFDRADVKRQLWQLKTQNGMTFDNVKFLWSQTPTGSHFVLYVSPHRVVTDEERKDGCLTSLYQHERDNPNIKLQQNDYRLRTEAVTKERGVFELLLYDETGAIREGMRSNFFWIQDGKICTAPNAHVLMGITRAQVLRCILARGYELEETLLDRADLDTIEACFLTSTSIDVLPIRAIDEKTYPSADHPMIRALAEDYLKTIEDYKNDFRW